MPTRREDKALLRQERAAARWFRIVGWAATPGSLLQAVAAVGVVVVLGQLLFGSISLAQAGAELSALVLIGVTLPPLFRRVGGEGTGSGGDGDA